MTDSTELDVPDINPAAPPAGHRNRRRLLLAAGGVVLVFAVVVTVALLVTSPGSAGSRRKPAAAAPSTAMAASAEPERPPTAGECYDSTYPLPGERATVRSFMPGKRALLPCSAPHFMEVVSVGTFPASATGTSDLTTNRLIMAGCETAVDAFLGGDFRMSYTRPLLLVPSSSMWTSGDRWFACVIAGLSDVGNTYGVAHAGSFRDGMRGSRPAAITCITATFGSDKAMTGNATAACSARHVAELAGVYRAPDGPWPSSDKLVEAGETGCGQVIAKYVGIRSWAANTNYHLSYLTWAAVTEQDWGLGLRDFRCFVVARPYPSTIVGSLKGIKNRTPQY